MAPQGECHNYVRMARRRAERVAIIHTIHYLLARQSQRASVGVSDSVVSVCAGINVDWPTV